MDLRSDSGLLFAIVPRYIGTYFPIANRVCGPSLGVSHCASSKRSVGLSCGIVLLDAVEIDCCDVFVTVYRGSKN